MALTAGDKLGPYQILTPIGKGGMGEVYRAHDPRTGREVAVKVAAERFSECFDREIRAIAALNHANVCTLYDVGPNYLVMELVEGKTLAEGLSGDRFRSMQRCASRVRSPMRWRPRTRRASFIAI